MKTKQQLFLIENGVNSHFHKGKKMLGSSAMSFVVDVFSPLDIHGNISWFYKPSCEVQLLNETERQAEVGGDLRAITLVQESEEIRRQPGAPIKGD